MGLVSYIDPRIDLIYPPNYEDMLKKIELIGRVCYKSEDKISDQSAENFIRGIIGRGHESVIEHESISVKVICDRGVSHEIVRHRIASYAQESTRYCNYSGEKFGGHSSAIDPVSGFGWDLHDQDDKRKHDIWMAAMEDADWYYLQMLDAGASPQEARSVLPTSLKTEIVITMNLREWRHFIRLRGSKAAHPQIREIVELIRASFICNYPVFFEDLEEEHGDEDEG